MNEPYRLGLAQAEQLTEVEARMATLNTEGPGNPLGASWGDHAKQQAASRGGSGARTLRTRQI
ncbi:MAG TPA: hypothetical protein VLA49_10385 [Anaerolineales bacterium]|nr:hypothetical protein [Anaerolineales bacterium]